MSCGDMTIWRSSTAKHNAMANGHSLFYALLFGYCTIYSFNIRNLSLADKWKIGKSMSFEWPSNCGVFFLYFFVDNKSLFTAKPIEVFE